MADIKISALPASNVPLVGTETLPIIQDGDTRRLTVDELTEGRAVGVGSLVAAGSVSAGSVASSGIVNAASASVIGAVNAGSVTSTGAVNAGSVTSTGAVNAGSVTSTGAVNAGSVTSTGAVNAGGMIKSLAPAGSADIVAQTTSPGGSGYSRLILKTANREWRVVADDTTSGAPLSIYDATVGAERWRVTNAGNLQQRTSGTGVDFASNPPTGGMTSQLLKWYEEGTWTPTDVSGAGLTFLNVVATYTRVGRLVTIQFLLDYPATASGATAQVGGLPFNPALVGTGTFYCNLQAGVIAQISNTLRFTNYSSGAHLTNTTLASRSVWGSYTYNV